MPYGAPEKHGLYDPQNEKDACGVGVVADIKGRRSHQIVLDAAPGCGGDGGSRQRRLGVPV